MAELTFTDFLIKPWYSEIRSRSEVDVKSPLITGDRELSLDLPVISSNMRDVTGPKMAAAMAIHGGLGLLHRFNPIDVGVAEFEEAVNLTVEGLSLLQSRRDEVAAQRVGVSIGVQPEDKDRCYALVEAGARIVCIDVAHGHHILVREMTEWIREQTFGSEIFLITGDVATFQGAYDLAEWGADAIRVGIGPGSQCQTRKNCGIGVPQVHACKEARLAMDIRKEEGKSVAGIIADGGIKEDGDIVKAMLYADAVMVGGHLSGTADTPGHVFTDPQGAFYKIYGGSASGESKTKSGGKNTFVEGSVTKVPFRGDVKYILRGIKEHLQMAYSYVGARDVESFRRTVKAYNLLSELSSGGRIESKI
jgi:IMP dehydrogenase/GMP reductase